MLVNKIIIYNIIEHFHRKLIELQKIHTYHIWFTIDQFTIKFYLQGWENTERIASLISYSQILTEPVSLHGLPCRFDLSYAYCPQDNFRTHHTLPRTHHTLPKWLELMWLCKSSLFTAAPASIANLFRCTPAKVSMHVQSQTKQSPTTTKWENCYTI